MKNPRVEDKDRFSHPSDADASFKRSDKYKYDVDFSREDHSRLYALHEFSPFQPKRRASPSSSSLRQSRNRSHKHSRQNSIKLNNSLRQQTTTFSPYEDRVRLPIKSKLVATANSIKPFETSLLDDLSLNKLSDFNKSLQYVQRSSLLAAEKDIFINELIRDNKILAEQLADSKALICRLEAQLSRKQGKVLESETLERAMLHERSIHEAEIRTVLEKNEILNERVVKMNLVLEEMASTLQTEYFSKIAKDKDPGRIRCSTKQLKSSISQIIRRALKLESFANCLIDMRNKIVGTQEQDLKKCWKWLKGFVQDLVRIKKLQPFQQQLRMRLRVPADVPSEDVFRLALSRL